MKHGIILNELHTIKNSEDSMKRYDYLLWVLKMVLDDINKECVLPRTVLKAHIRRALGFKHTFLLRIEQL